MLRQKSIVLVVMLCGLLCAKSFVNAQSAAEKGQPFLVNYSPKAFDFYPQNWSCVEDKHGLMYFGNVGYILQYDGASWRKIALSTATQSTTRSLINSSDGRIFFGTVGDLGYLAPDSSGTTRCVSLLSYIPASQRNFYDVWTIYEGDKGIYFQSRDYIFRFTSTITNAKEAWQVKTWPAKAKYLYSFYLDGTYYVHEQNAGLFKMVNDSLVLVPGSEFLGKDRMQVMLPYPLANGKKGYLMGMFYSGIYLYDGERFTLFKTEADNIIKSALLYKALLLKNGNYALSTTGKGLIIIDRNGKIIQKINRDVGLQDESVYEVYEDAQLVRSISAGSLKLNPAQDSAHDEQLIPYSDNSIRIEYASPFYEQEQKTKYQTWLEGFDKKRSDWWYNNYKEYTNLPEGKYTFHVRAQNVFEKISEEAVYHFEISAPWYRTWWAYLLYFLIVAIVISFFINYRSRALTKQNKMLEENVASRTQQLNASVEELKSTQAQLIQSEKMASLGELTAGIAHEIQNPLNFVNNFSDLNKELIDEMNVEIDKGNLDEAKAFATDIRSNEEKINSHGKRADAIVKGMLQHSRSRTGIKEATDINALASEYLRLVNHNLRGKDNAFNVTTMTDFDESIGNINIVPQDVGRVLLNLYNNAFYAVSERKKVEGAGYEPAVSISTKRSGNHVLITVRDNGIGMPQKVIDKIFQPFFTTKPAGQGTGLGLSLSYDIIKAHGGEIKVNTKENEGSEFVVELA